MTRFQYRTSCLLVFALASASAQAGARLQIVSEAKADKHWLPAVAPLAPPYPEGATNGIGDVCVSIGYYLGENGVPSEFSLLKTWVDPKSGAGREKHGLEIFEQTAVAALMQRRFVPAKPGKPRPIYTSATFVFPAARDYNEAPLRARCAIPDLGVFIAKAQREADPASWNEIRWNGEWFHAKNTRAHGLNRE